MKNSQWKITDSLPGGYTQLRLFAPTTEEILIARMNELEAKLERQRKGQFGNIGRALKQCKELQERLEIMEKGLCIGSFECKAALQESNNTCEILEMAVM
jgi:hypothetical protein